MYRFAVDPLSVGFCKTDIALRMVRIGLLPIFPSTNLTKKYRFTQRVTPAE